MYTANADISSIRAVLAEAAQDPEQKGISGLDMNTAFLNTPMFAEEEEQVYVYPPSVLVDYGLNDHRQIFLYLYLSCDRNYHNHAVKLTLLARLIYA